MHRLDLRDPDERILGRVLRRQAEAVPDAPFVLAGSERLSYGDVDRQADEHAAGLHGLGVGPGDTVAVLMEGCPELVALTFAVNRLGAVWIPANVDYEGTWLHDALARSRARVLAVDADLLPRVAELDESLPFEHVVVRGSTPASTSGALAGAALHPFGDLPTEPHRGLEADAHRGDTVAVLWTSGTTGRAKGVMQSHNAWIRAAQSGAVSSGTREGDVLYCCLPMYNSAAWVGVVYRALVSGLAFGLDPRFSVEQFWDRTRFYGATQTFTLGAMHIYLMQAPERPDDDDNPVRAAGAIPMPEQLLEPFKERFGIELVQQGYGQSEIMGLVSRLDDGRRTWNPDAAGEPMEGVEVTLLDDEDRPVPAGEVGELCVRPSEPYVLFNGYFGAPEATLRSCRNLWYHTGDLGRRDGDGQFHFVDRKADYIRHKGRSVSSFAVEAAVSAHPSVAESAAFGVRTAELDSEAEIMVAVVPHPGAELTEEELARYVNDHAPHFFVPRYVELVDDLPHTPTGRVRKFVLRERGVTDTTWDREASGFEVRR